MTENEMNTKETNSPFPEFEEKEFETELTVEDDSIYKCLVRDPNCLVKIIFKNGSGLKFEHWAPPTEFLYLWGKPNKGTITLNIDDEHYITIDKSEVVSKSVQPIH